MSTALFRAPLSAPAEFVGTVDATRERSTPMPRTLEQAFGEQAAHGHIVPMSTPVATHPADRIVGWGCAAGAIALVAFASLGWLS